MSHNNKYSLRIFYQNARGLRTKTNTFYNNILSCNYDLICISETWLCNGVLDSELTDSNYNVIRRDRATLGGGVMALCTARLHARARPEWDRSDLECVWLTIDSSSLGSASNLHVAIVYIPPNRLLPERVQLFMESLSLVIEANPNDHILVTGDFNLPCISWTQTGPKHLKKGSIDTQNSAINLLNHMNYLGFDQYNTITNTHKNTLDLVFCNFSVELVRSTHPLVEEDGYHPSLEIDAHDITIPPTPRTVRHKLSFKRADYESINKYFSTVNWSSLTDSETVDKAVEFLYDHIRVAIQKYVPKVLVHGTYQYPIWYSRALINIIKEKSKAHSRWKRYKNPTDYDTFSLLRARQKKITEECHLSYLRKSQDCIKRNPKLLWSYVRSKRKSDSGYPKIMQYENRQLSNTQEICQAFNNYFERMFTKPADTYPNTELPSSKNMSNNLHTIEISEDDVLKLLKNLDISKGAGSDNIPPSFIVKCAPTLARPIYLVFARSLREGIFPESWKQAHIVPIHKKGLKSSIENYRPISILNTLSKVLEKVVYNGMYPTLSLGIPPEQHGFLKGRSTVTNLAIFTSDVLQSMDERCQVDVVYTDFEKAFDRVDHVILLRKLQKLGIHGNLLRWVQSYISNRTQAVTISGLRSNFICIPSGVPQGSLLGPLLYIAFIYDIGVCLQHAKHLLYADDKKVYVKITNSQDSIRLQEDLDRLAAYYEVNRINVNIAKCIHVTFSRSPKPLEFTYYFNKIPIGKATTVRDLGVVLDSKLSFSEHIETVVDKAYKNLGFVLRVSKPFTDVVCVRALYYAYVRSVLEYGASVWNPQYITYIHAVERIQRIFVKHLDYRTHNRFTDYNTSCRRHKLTSLENRRHLLDMTLLHDVCSGTIDCTDLINSMLQLATPSKRTRHTKLFSVPSVNTKYAQNSIPCRIRRNYNNTFSEIDVFNTSKEVFKNKIIEILNNQTNIQ